MTLHRVAVLIVVLALCGCDRLGKIFAPPVPVAKKTLAAPPPPIPPLPPVAEVPREAVEASPPLEEEAPKKTAEATPAPTDPPLVLFEDSFADVAGSIRRKIDGKQQPGEGPQASRTVYTFQATPEDGTFTSRIFEDNQTAGPDGKPGVLAVGWDEVPKKLAWNGFVYLGGVQGARRMTLPKLQAARTVDDLRKMRLKFTYRGVNPPNGTPVQLPIDCRLEPVIEDSFKHRIDFGVLAAGDEWKTLDVSLADGKNLEAFLKMVAESHPPGFKIVFGQSGPITGYHAGDTLQIDDISVTSVVMPAE